MLRRSKTDRAAAAAAEAAAELAAQRGAVLVVNDDDGALELLCRVLERTGLTTLRASDIDGAVHELHHGGRIDGIVLDLSTGTAPSLAVLEAIRQEQPLVMPAVMLIATTAANRTLAYDSGVDEFLTRPFHVDELVAGVETMTGRSAEERAALRQQASIAGRGLQELQD